MSIDVQERELKAGTEVTYKGQRAVIVKVQWL